MEGKVNKEYKKYIVELEYNSEIQSQKKIYRCKANERMKVICSQFCKDINIEFSKVLFLYNGTTLNPEDYDKPVEECIQGGGYKLSIIVDDISQDEEIIDNKDKNVYIKNQNNYTTYTEKVELNKKKCKVNFKFKNISTSIECEEEDTLIEVCESFAEKNKLKINSLNFIYNNKILDTSKKLKEIETNEDLNKMLINIYVEDKKSFLAKNKKKIIIILIVVIILIIVSIILALKLKNPKIPCKNENCLEFKNSGKNCECSLCKEGFELFKDECIKYKFYAKYIVDYYHEKINIFNSKYKNDLIAIKIDDILMEPNHEAYFNNINKNKVYFYFKEKKEIILSFFFENMNKLIEFSFNKNIDDNININMKGMFNNCNSLTDISLNLSERYKVNDISYLFSNCTSLININISIKNSKEIEDMSSMFLNCTSLKNIYFENLNTQNVKDMSSMFYNCNSLTSLDISNFDTYNVNQLSSMLYNCNSLISLNLRYFNVLNVKDMSNIFYNCHSLLNIDLSNFITEKVTNMGYMFYNCTSLTSLDISKFKTENVIYMQGMFAYLTLLTSLDVSNFNTKNVINMDSLFFGCSSLQSIDISNFNTENVIYIGGMFYNCNSLTSLDISKFNTENVTDMRFMFYNYNSLT